MTEQDFQPHKMYHPKTGEVQAVKTYAQHLSLKKKGFSHRTPQRESYTEAVDRRMRGGGY